MEHLFINYLLNRPEWIIYAEEVKPEYLEEETHREILQCLINAETKDLRGLMQQSTNPHIHQIIAKRLQECYIPTFNPSLLEFAAHQVVKRYIKRRLGEISTDSVAEAETEIKKLKELDFINDEKTDVSSAFCSNLDRAYQGLPDNNLINTDFHALDAKIDGFRNSELILIGARPAMGKTTFALNLAYRMSKNKKKVVFYSLEMAEEELHARLVKDIANLKRIDGSITAAEMEKAIKISKRIKEALPLNVIDKGSLSVEDIYAKSSKLKAQGLCDVIFIDHLSILKSSKSFKSRYEELTEITRMLKIMAKELNVPVVALCQLNRAVESEQNKIPTMSHLRDSGSAEQDSDLIAFIHRPAYYKQLKGEPVTEQEKTEALLSIAKNRRGETGLIQLGFAREYPRFYDIY